VVIAAWHFRVNIIEDKPLSSLWAQKNPALMIGSSSKNSKTKSADNNTSEGGADAVS
jgi:hypothetical protein